jgi:hypothetical protein
MGFQKGKGKKNILNKSYRKSTEKKVCVKIGNKYSNSITAGAKGHPPDLALNLLSHTQVHFLLYRTRKLLEK